MDNFAEDLNHMIQRDKKQTVESPQISDYGELIYTHPVKLTVSTPRINAVITPGGIKKISVWGQGPMANISLLPTMPFNFVDTYSLLPNIFTIKNATGLLRIYTIVEKPTLIVENRGFIRKLKLKIHPYKKQLTGFKGKTQRETSKDSILYRLPHGTIAATEVKSAEGSFFIISAGEYEEVIKTIKEVSQNPDKYTNSAINHAQWIGSRFRSKNSLLNSLFVHCLHSALSAYKEDALKNFAGLSAGPGYSLPARTYYRDSYWTIQTLLPFKPHWVRKEIKILAQGIRENGEAPSGVIIPTPIGKKYWAEEITSNPSLKKHHKNPNEWWSDHFDSPLFFILMVFDYLQWTKDYTIFNERINGRSIWKTILTIINRYKTLPSYGSLPLKPYNDRDWADNVFRSGLVTYNSALYYRALYLSAKWASINNQEIATELWERAKRVKKGILSLLWLNERGHFVEYISPDKNIEETHINLDTLTAAKFGITTKEQTEKLLSKVSRILETRNNKEQPYGDWGIMCTYPPYKNRQTLRGKTAFPYRYHNGSDWPYLDGLYADLLLYHRKKNWEYPLTRWWEYSLSMGWTEPVEYYSPPWGKGALLQAWSSMPASAIINGGFGVHPERHIHPPPWGDSHLREISLFGKILSLSVKNGKIHKEQL